MWLVAREGKHVMRHFCEDKDGLRSFGWKEHNGIDYGQQILVETDLRLETSFVKSKVGNLGYGGDWSVRIKVENKAWYVVTILFRSTLYVFHIWCYLIIHIKLFFLLLLEKILGMTKKKKA